MGEASQEIVILVVDDDLQVTTFIRRALETHPAYSILTAGSGTEAWSMADRSATIDVLITEIDLVGSMSGVELSGRIQQRHPSVKLLFVSGAGIGQLAAYPDRPVLRKPFSAEELSAMVRQAVGTKGRTGDAAA